MNALETAIQQSAKPKSTNPAPIASINHEIDKLEKAIAEHRRAQAEKQSKSPQSRL